MQEVKLKENKTDLIVYANGLPNLSNMPADVYNLLAKDIELHFVEYWKKKRHRTTRKPPT